MSKEAMKLALEALKEAQTNNDGPEYWDRNKNAIKALEEALAKQGMTKQGITKQQEPVEIPNGLSRDEFLQSYYVGASRTIKYLEIENQRLISSNRTWRDAFLKIAEERDALKADGQHLKVVTATPPAAQPAPVRLTNEQIEHLWETRVSQPCPSYPLGKSDWVQFAQAIEAAHGIKE
jgi:hypothetical protein